MKILQALTNNWFKPGRCLPPTRPNTKTVMLGGIPTVMEGAMADSYFQNLEGYAAELDSLAALLARRVPRTAAVIDVGANIGLSTILMARLAGHVTAYEPSPPNVTFLRRNLERNGIANVEVRAAAASSRPGTLRFHVAEVGAASHVVAPGHMARRGIRTVDVPAATLDDADDMPSGTRIAFVKIDAEGHEPDVLAGARRLLTRDRPLVYTEVNVWCLSAFAGHSPEAFVRALWQAFKVSRAMPNGTLVPLPNGYDFIYDVIVNRGGYADVVLRPRKGARMPTLPELSWPEAAIDALRAAHVDRAELLQR